MLAVAASRTAGQTTHATPAAPGAAREVRGVLTRAVGTGGRPLAGAWVTLHRVGTDGAAPLDSTRTDASGRFSFRDRASGDTSALYFVSSRYAGIAYFTPPLRKMLVAGGEADLVVFDTTSAAVPIHVQGHHIVVMAPDSTRQRRVIEAYELSNDSSITRVAGARERPTFEAILPDGAREPRATDGDVAADAVTFTAGRVQLFAPIAPGIKQLSLAYHVPATGEPITVASLAPVSVLEVLVEGTTGSVSGAGLKETDFAVLGGRRFRRFLTNDAPANSVITIVAPAAQGSLNSRIALIVTAIAAMMLLALARSFARRDPARARARSADADDPESLARQITALETSFANLDSPTAEQRADLYEARAHLVARRTAALARREAAP
jgi:hypothetical protein